MLMAKFVDQVTDNNGNTYYVTGYVESGWFGKESKFYITGHILYNSTTNIVEAKKYLTLKEALDAAGIFPSVREVARSG